MKSNLERAFYYTLGLTAGLLIMNATSLQVLGFAPIAFLIFFAVAAIYDFIVERYR